MINHPKVVIREDFKEMYLPPEVTKTSKGRDVPLNKVASQAAQRLQKSINYSFTHSVFYDRWWNCREALGYRDDKTFVFHVCRHTALTNMANKNVNSLIIGEIAGHASIQTTKRYVHGDSKARASAVADI
jgi:integrase